MRRADRLFELIQLLRRARKPITAAQLAEALEVTPRTVYRDIAALMAMRVPIRRRGGCRLHLAAGIRPAAADVGARRGRGDCGRVAAPEPDRRIRICKRLPVALSPRWPTSWPEVRADELDDGRFVVSEFGPPTVARMGMLRSAIRDHRRVALVYRDERERLTERTCLPLAVI